MLVVSDASPIRALEWVGLVHILSTLFDKVVVPPAVAAELDRRDGPHRRIELSRFDFIQVTRPQNPAIVQELQHILDPGESEALALASEVPDSLLLIDERAGRQHARKMNLHVVGPVGIRVTARRRALIPGSRSILEVLRTELRFFLSDEVIAEALRAAGEESV